jgi:hypothetical protein
VESKNIRLATNGSLRLINIVIHKRVDTPVDNNVNKIVKCFSEFILYHFAHKVSKQN